MALRVAGLRKDAPRSGRIPTLSIKNRESVLEATRQTPPPHETPWSVRSLAKTQGLSRMAVQRMWKPSNLKPPLVKTFKLSRDQHVFEKLQNVVGLDLNPPDNALGWCVDEKSQMQALERTQPSFPLKKGRCGTMTHDDKRHGTTTLFAA